LLARFRQFFPGHEYETLLLEELPELRALDHVQIVLPHSAVPGHEFAPLIPQNLAESSGCTETRRESF
jgi:hypothetical protein